jgi:hypothetical protein
MAQQAQSGSALKLPRKKTRQKNTVFGIGAGITEADAQITGCRLPTSSLITFSNL